MSSVVQVTLEM